MLTQRITYDVRGTGLYKLHYYLKDKHTITIFRFDSANELLLFDQSVRVLRGTMDDIWKRYQRSRHEDPIHPDGVVALHDWIASVNDLALRFGDKLVPDDIRQSSSNTERYLNMYTTPI